MERRPDGLSIRVSLATQAYLLVFLGVLGPGMTAMAVVRWEELVSRPWPVVAALAFFVVFAWGYLVRLLFVDRRLELAGSVGAIRFFSRRGGGEAGRIALSEIAALETSEEGFTSGSRRRIRNHVLWVRTRQGRKVALCITPDGALVGELREAISRAAGLERET